MPLIKHIPLIGSFEEKFGGTVETSSTKPVATTAGLFGPGYTFGPTTTYVKGNDLKLTPEMSFSLWVKFNTLGNGFLLDCRSGEAGYQPMYFNTSSGIQFYSSGTKTGGYVSLGSNTITTGEWYHFVMVLKNNVARLYGNGSFIGSVEASGLTMDSYATIGNRHSFATGAPGCIIQDVKIYNHALSQKEIYDLSKGQLVHYNFDDYVASDTSKVIDCGDYGFNATNNGVTIDTNAATGLYSGYFNTGYQWLAYSGLPARDDQLTVSLWFKSSNTSPLSGYHIPFTIDTGRVEISIPGSDGYLRFGGYTSNNSRVCNNIQAKTAAGAAVSLLNGQWHMITLVYDGTGWSGYTNGVYIGKHAATGTISYASKVMTIGRYYNDATSSYGVTQGYISDVKVFNTVLSATDIKNLYNEKARIDRDGNLFVKQINTNNNATSEFSPTGLKKVKYLSEVIHLSDGSTWLQVSHHNNKGGTNLFSSSDKFETEFVYHNKDCWAAFNLIKEHGLYNSKYEFMAWEQLTTTENFVVRRWSQKVSPFTATYNTVNPGNSNVTHIENMPSRNGGMYKINSSTYFCITNASNGNWYGAFGSWNSHGTGIPTFDNSSTAGTFDLFVRVDPSVGDKYREFKQGIIMPNSINIV